MDSILNQLPTEKWVSHDAVVETLRTDETLTRAQYCALAERLAWLITPATVDTARWANWIENGDYNRG